MFRLLFLSLVPFINAAPQGFSFSHHQRQARQPHMEYGPAPTTFSMKNFLNELQTQNGDYESQNVQNINSIDEYATPKQFSTNAMNSLQTSRLQPPLLNYENEQHFDNFENQLANPIISKRFFLHSAPEEVDEEVQEKHIIVGKPRKNYNVVFIKSAVKPTQRTALKIVPALNEERTIIYVLAKKPEASEIDTQVQEPVTTTIKPEVYFIKYKTNEEAEHAQQSIQAQYDVLGGLTHLSNEGLAPVSSVIGALDGVNHKMANQNGAYTLNESGGTIQGLSNGSQQEFGVQQAAPIAAGNESNGYLPPELRI